MPNDNSPSGDKEGTPEVPTIEQIDLVFAALIDGGDAVTSGPMSEAVLSLTASHWSAARDLVTSSDFSPEDVNVEEVAEEWL